MPDKKLTDVTDNKFGEMSDSEIVKALECCIKWKRKGDCAKCPLYESDKLCVKEIRILALDLINRLQAEKEELVGNIDKLKAELFDKTEQLNVELQAMRGAANSYKAENERLKKGWKADVILTANVKAEAYKECIEKVKEKSKKTEIVCSGKLITTNYTISARNFNNLLKELVGEDNESQVK